MRYKNGPFSSWGRDYVGKRGILMGKKLLAAALAISCLGVMGLLLSGCSGSSSPQKTEVQIGGLFSLTGNWQTLGKSGSAAVEIAVEDINAYTSSEGLPFHFSANIQDTRLDPSVARQKTELLADSGVRFVIGPQSSAEVQEVKAVADERGIIVVSPSSTAGSLAIANDNVFRFCPSDDLEGQAISALMAHDGITAVVPVWRDDAGNEGLQIATRAYFTSSGGEMSEGVKYGADVQDFSPVVASLSSQVASASEKYGPSSTAVYLAGFDEVSSLFSLASKDPVLASVAWYGSNGVALSDALLADSGVAAFASSRGYPCPILGLQEKDRDIWQPLADRIKERSGVYPDAYALAAYDAAWVIARTYISAGGGTDDLALLKQKFVEAAAAYSGATGNTALNAAGDRLSGNYDYWEITSGPAGFFWQRVGAYDSLTGAITFYYLPN